MRIEINPAMRKGLYVAAFMVVLFLVLSVLKKSGGSAPMDATGFVDEFVKFLKGKEGHASSDPGDAAAANSWPNGVHTYMGVTKSTFEGNAHKCGYSPTYANFNPMKPQIWWCNYEQFYNKGKTWSGNVVLATYMSQWYWGSGGWDVGERYNTNWKQLVTNIFNSAISDRAKFHKLIALRIEYFKKRVAAVPHDQIYLNGWITKHNQIKEKFSKYLQA